MSTIQKTIVSRPLRLLAAFILPLCLAVPAPCAAASAADPATRANHRFLPSGGLDVDPTDIFIPIPPPPPPPARV